MTDWFLSESSLPGFQMNTFSLGPHMGTERYGGEKGGNRGGGKRKGEGKRKGRRMERGEWEKEINFLFL
jgi:hypothetical protein